ncbi:MAG: acetyl-CoA carboxylase carboxyltransferase subunit beta [Nitrospinaceae bacterium]|jgi:acetyl-CoA carboxylase carboxyl transferase subunit beta|nr:acetyl-CoA carboxylase carboxyltransferase subunit beta [Nitrospina sp.]MBT5375613.1 acetyl-CoA carboxylase carboxyltransferase subunit beta [Nitrospinaceae bacterium]MBT5868819.1 acetyl-CoA carboxylase carboxyltransferase subunit beta [Nitrospinaceae bacterium]MBT6346775.1 acetyl-CoA carboxylase carboxyltransferase subunit beta [Nitrospina sp.]
MSWIDKLKAGIGAKKTATDQDLWVECKKCKEQVYIAELEDNLKICPHCDYHFRLGVRQRIHQLIDLDTFTEFDQNLTSSDPLKFKDTKKYKDRIKTSAKKGISNDAVVSGSGMMQDLPLEICVFDFSFMGGSMGSVVGEKITRAIERAIENQSALVIISSSGGARMQEGIFSLMQMAKTSSALSQLSEKKIPYISVLTDPTMGGVSASFSMLGDIIIAEPGALIGFAGPRVIEQVIKQKLPKGFQTAEFLLEHGLIDNVVHRKDLKTTLAQLFRMLKNNPAQKQEEAEPETEEPVLTKPPELLGA